MSKGLVPTAIMFFTLRGISHDAITFPLLSPHGAGRCRRCSDAGLRSRVGGRLEHALGATAQSDPAISRGPVSKILAVIIIIVTGLSLAFGDTSGGFRRLIQIVFGLSIAFAASSFFLSFFSFGGGVLV